MISKIDVTPRHRQERIWCPDQYMLHLHVSTLKFDPLPQSQVNCETTCHANILIMCRQLYKYSYYSLRTSPLSGTEHSFFALKTNKQDSDQHNYIGYKIKIDNLFSQSFWLSPTTNDPLYSFTLQQTYILHCNTGYTQDSLGSLFQPNHP